jgi:hypothetical protein
MIITIFFLSNKSKVNFLKKFKFKFKLNYFIITYFFDKENKKYKLNKNENLDLSQLSYK